MERKKKVQKYIVSGTKKYRFSVLNFNVKNSKKRRVEKGGHENYKVSVNNVKFEGYISERKQNKYKVNINGNSYSFSIDSERTHKRKKALNLINGGDKLVQVKSPMPGKICEIIAGEGISVQKGMPLLTLEAMKMQNEIQSPVSAKVKSIFVNHGDNVMKGQPMLELELQ